MAAFAHDTLLPRAPGGNGVGALLALLAHAGLLLALTVTVNWRSTPPEAVSAELWASVPQAAAARPDAVAAPTPAPTPTPTPTPPPPAPAPAPLPKPAPAVPAAVPAPRPADIAVEREQRRKAEALRQKAEADALDRKRIDAERKQADAARKKREQDEQKQAQAAETQLALQRQQNLKRMMGQAEVATGATGATGTAAQAAGPSAAYSARVAKLVRDASVFTGSVAGNPAAEVLVRAGPSGTILSRTLVKSSGFKQWDDAVLQAIDKVGSLPRDTDGRVPAAITIVFRPNE